MLLGLLLYCESVEKLGLNFFSFKETKMHNLEFLGLPLPTKITTAPQKSQNTIPYYKKS